MKNLKKGRTLGRNSAKRKALFQSLAISLIEHEGIKTQCENVSDVQNLNKHNTFCIPKVSGVK